MKSQIVSAAVLAVSLLACAQEAAVQPHSSQNAEPLPSQVQSVRVIVQFKNPTAVDAQAFVQRLRTLTAAPVGYVAAVSANTHVYTLKPPPGQSNAQLLQQLGAMPEIARAEFDQKVQSR